MARKGRESLTEAPPPAASSSEESDSESGEYESSSEDEGDQQPQQPPMKVSESDSDTDSNADSDTDSDTDPKPTPSEHPKSKPTSLPTPNVTVATAVSNKRKNTKENTSDKDLTPKKAKKDNKGEPSESASVPEESGKKLFQRLWSDNDEIVILKGLIDFKEKKGKNPMSDVDGFLDFIKNSLHVADVKKEQIVSKVRRLKGRYENAKKRTLTNPHELQAFELSKTIWGGSDNGADENNAEMSAKSPKSKSNVKSKGVKNVSVNGGVSIDGGKKVEDADEKTKVVVKTKSDEGNAGTGGVVMRMNVSHGIQLGELNKFGNMDERFMNEGLMLLGDDERDALEEEWFNFNVVQMEALEKRLELYHKTTKSLLNAFKSSKR